jgi:hypothetical protein
MYTPYIGDEKRDVVEYTSLGFLGSQHTMLTYTRCMDSVLCVPLMIDAAVWCDHFARLGAATEDAARATAYLFKVPEGGARGVDPGFGHQMRVLEETLVRLGGGGGDGGGGGGANPAHAAFGVEHKDDGRGDGGGGQAGGGADAKDTTREEELLLLVGNDVQVYTPENLERIYALIESEGIDLKYQVSRCCCTPLSVVLVVSRCGILPACSLDIILDEGGYALTMPIRRSINMQDRTKTTCLGWATHKVQVNIVERLLKKDPSFKHIQVRHRIRHTQQLVRVSSEAMREVTRFSRCVFAPSCSF